MQENDHILAEFCRPGGRDISREISGLAFDFDYAFNFFPQESHSPGRVTSKLLATIYRTSINISLQQYNYENKGSTVVE